MYELKNWKVFTSKFVGTGPSSYKRKFTGPRSRKCWETLGYAVSLVMSVLCGCVTCTLTLRVLDVRMLMKIFGTKIGEVTGGWRKIHWGASFSVLLDKLERSNEEWRDGQSVWHVCGRRDVDMDFGWGGVWRRGNMWRLGHRWKDDRKRILENLTARAWRGLIWLKVEASGGIWWRG